MQEFHHKSRIFSKEEVEKNVLNFVSILHQNSSYFTQFLMCEFLNFLVLIFNYCLTNWFLNGQFYHYGWEVLSFYRYRNVFQFLTICTSKVIYDSFRLSNEDQIMKSNPFCTVFPIDVGCSVPLQTATGNIASLKGFCTLSQNKFNQWIYLVIWVWMELMICISPIHIIYRLCTLVCGCFRSSLLLGKMIIMKL